MGRGAVLAALLATVACYPVDDTTTRVAFPHDATTGPEALSYAEHSLPTCASEYGTPSSGVWTITAPGALYEECTFTGASIVVDTNDPDSPVTLRGMEVYGDAAILIEVDSGYVNVHHSVVAPDPNGTRVGPSGEQCAAAVGHSSFEVVGSEVYGCADGFKVSGTSFIIGSFVHDLDKTCHPVNTTNCTHNDVMQYPENSGVHGTIHVDGNAFYMDSCTSNRHFQAKHFAGSATFEDNFFYGGNGLVMGDGTASMALTMTNNVLAGSKTQGPFNTNSSNTQMIGLLGGSGYASVTHSGNAYEDSSSVDTSDWRESPYSCAAS